MPSFEHDSISLHFEASGDGPPLLLIAGMLSDSASWAPLVPLLEPHFTVIRPDNRSTGRTAPWNAPASIDHCAADCAALVDSLSIGPAHVVGHSLGGMIGLRMAHRYPSAVGSLTLAAAAPLRLERNVALFRNLLAIRQSNAAPETWLHTLFAWLFAPALYDIPGAVAQAATTALAYPYAQTAAAMAHQIASLDGYRPDGLDGVPMPVQALLAADDLLLPEALARNALGATPTHIVPDAGHSIHWDAPEAVAAHIRRFTDQ
ncbi:alpha/beta fold hydrolase [Sulfitobacter albidus]|uniref:Alpha/beta fold hydrolase n=1 Tax=Sulfitobacter albidus TaxID=2829501 RepID=A0A975JCZ4_9RHOB|nr:alpha/beta fold hydrolase [Sulfitobacter albidus]QUJ75970.1 alpha/beta fold hydrolase [Sulfitobacter albidus]